MANIIIQVSKYLIIILMAAYTFSCFSIFTRSYEDEENKVLIRQDVLLFMIQITAFIAMYFATQDLRMMFIYGALAVIVMAVILLYNLIYPNVSRLVVNNMCMFITEGMIMITLWNCNPSAGICCCWYCFWSYCSGSDPEDDFPGELDLYLCSSWRSSTSYRCIVCSNTWRSKAEFQYWTCESAAF